MNWTRPADIKTLISKWWDSGGLLADFVAGENGFPKEIKLRQPTAKEMTERFAEVRSWIAEVRKLDNCELEMREINHRVLGKNSIPYAVKIATADDAITIIGKRRDANRFRSIVDTVRLCEPELLPWLHKRPHKAIELHDHWDHLLKIVSWMRAHPRPGVFLRQVDIAGIHSKMIEEHRAVLSELLDLVLPPDCIDHRAIGVSQFARRYGFLDKPTKIRFRILDPDCMLLPGVKGGQDITIDRDGFSTLHPPISRVFITENEINYLAFPQVKDGMVIFGAGYGFDVLSSATWLYRCQIYYWGDIDTHGFNILNSARKELPHIRSLLMDEKTLLRHRDLWVTEDDQHGAVDLRRLTDQEHDIYTRLRNHFWGQNVRLEQERLSWNHVESNLAEALLKEPESAQETVNDADIYEALTPSKCDLRVYLNTHHPVEKQNGPFEQIVKGWARKARLAHKEQFPDLTDLSELDSSSRKKASNAAILDRCSVIYKPLLAVPYLLNGNDTEIRGEPDFLIRDGNSYVVRNIKIARRVNEAEHPETFIEAQLHGFLFEQISGCKPARIEIISGDDRVIGIEYDGGRSALRTLTEIMVTRQLPAAPYSPVGWSKCGGCAFHEFCWQKAEKQHDVSLLVGVDQKLAGILRRSNCTSVEAILQFGEDKLSSLQTQIGGKSVRVGKRASRILQMATALVEKRHTVFERPALPDSDNFAILDLEGLPPHLDHSASVFLWGLQVFGTKPGQYLSAMADNDTTNDGAAWLLFLNNAMKVFEEYGDIPFIHWHNYERTMLERYIERYGDQFELANRIQKNLVDLHALLKESIALPLPSYSLKVVEKYLGFRRSQAQYGGDRAMAKYIESMELVDRRLRDQLHNEIAEYNREDLEATWFVFDWLRTESVSRTDQCID